MALWNLVSEALERCLRFGVTPHVKGASAVNLLSNAYGHVILRDYSADPCSCEAVGRFRAGEYRTYTLFPWVQM